MNTVIAVTTVALLFAGLLWVYLAHRRKKDLEFVSFVLPTVPKPDSPLKDKAEWILDCDIAIGVSLDVRGVLSALDGDIIQSNFDILKKIASTHNQLLRMGSPEEPLEAFGLNLLKESLEGETHTALVCFLWRFYCSALKLVESDASFRQLILNHNPPPTPTTQQLHMLLNLAVDNYSKHSKEQSNPVTDKMVASMLDFMAKKEREGLK